MSLALQRRTQGYFPCRAAANERLEIRSGKPGAADWEWGLGANTQVASQLVNINNIDWTSGKPIRFTLNYTGTGAATLNLYDSLTNNLLATKSYTNTASPLRVGNAIKLYIKQSAGSGAGVKVRAQISKINGNTLTTPLDLETTGDNLFNDKSAYAETPTAAGQTGMMVDGQVTVTWGSNPFPNGSRLGVTINAGSAPCVGGGSTTGTTTGSGTSGTSATTPVGTPGVTTLYFAHPDHLGTPRAITTSDATNTKVWEWSNSDAFGANLPNEDPANTGTAFKYNLRFPGQYFDQETGTSYNYFRDYDPATGRYIQSDPIGLQGGINTYGYVSGSPIANYDPFGLQGCPALPDPCPPLIQQIEYIVAQMNRRYIVMLTDPESLWIRAFKDKIPGHEGLGTWKGHIEYYEGLRNGLRTRIEIAVTNNCAVPPDAYVWLNTPAPTQPLPKTPLKK